MYFEGYITFLRFLIVCLLDCVKHITVSNTLLCQTYITVSKTLLCQTSARTIFIYTVLLSTCCGRIMLRLRSPSVTNTQGAREIYTNEDWVVFFSQFNKKGELTNTVHANQVYNKWSSLNLSFYNFLCI